MCLDEPIKFIFPCFIQSLDDADNDDLPPNIILKNRPKHNTSSIKIISDSKNISNSKNIFTSKKAYQNSVNKLHREDKLHQHKYTSDRFVKYNPVIKPIHMNLPNSNVLDLNYKNYYAFESSVKK